MPTPKRWSYLTSPLLNNVRMIEQVTSITTFRETNLKFTSYGNFKIFKKTIKFRKHSTGNSRIVRRRYTIRKRLLNHVKFSYLLHYWSNSYKSLREFWRFYQSYGLFQLNIAVPSPNVFYNAFRSEKSFAALSINSISSKFLPLYTAHTIKSQISYQARAIESPTKYSRNTTLTLFNSQPLISQIEVNKYLTPSLVRVGGAYFPFQLLELALRQINVITPQLTQLGMQKQLILRLLLSSLTLRGALCR